MLKGKGREIGFKEKVSNLSWLKIFCIKMLQMPSVSCGFGHIY